MIHTYTGIQLRNKMSKQWLYATTWLNLKTLSRKSQTQGYILHGRGTLGQGQGQPGDKYSFLCDILEQAKLIYGGGGGSG